MDNFKYTPPATISDIHKNMGEHGTNPRALIRDVFAHLKLVTNGQVDIVDATNPYVHAIESAVVLTAGFISEDHVLNRNQYAAAAQLEEDLWHHMTDVDYINLFAVPSEGSFIFLLNYDELLNKMVYDSVLDVRKVIIPRHTKVTVGGITFTLEYPIEIMELKHGGIRVIYNTDEISPLQTLSSNMIDYKIISNTGINNLIFRVKMKQFDIVHEQYPVNISAKIEYSKVLTDQFYTARIFTFDENSTVERELLTTFSPSIYNENTPTALLKLVDNTLTFTIPQIYYKQGVLGNRIRLEIYETIGDLAMDIGSYSQNEFNMDRSTVRPFKQRTAFSAPLDSMSFFACQSDIEDTITTGGRDALSFDALKERTINNVTGRNVIPISNVAMESNLIDQGFEIVKNIDVVTNRTYLATKALPDPKQTKLITAASASIESLMIKMADAVKFNTTYDNGMRVTLSPDTIYHSTNGTLGILPDNRVKQLLQMTAENRVIEVNKNNYFYSPFHYVMDASNNEFDLRAYYMDKPLAIDKSYVEDNGSTLIAATIDSYVFERISEGYRLTVTLKTDAKYNTFPDDRLFAQASFIPPGEKDYCYLNGRLLTNTQTKQKIFEFDITTDFDLDSKDRLLLTSFLMYNKDPKSIPVDLVTSFDITFGVIDDLTPQWVENDLDKRMGWFLLESNSKAIVCERIECRFGYELHNLWRRARTYTSEESYQIHNVDIPKRYLEDDIVVEVVNGQVVYTTKHKKGDVVKDSTGAIVYLAKKGDYVLDENGKNVLKEPRDLTRFMDIMLIEAAYWFATDPIGIEYRKEITDTFVDWIVDGLGSKEEILLEQTEIYFYPKSTLGYISVMYNNGIFSTISAAQSMNMTLYVSNQAHTDGDLQDKIKETAIREINNALKENTVAKSEVYNRLVDAFGKDVSGMTLTGLGSNDDIVLFSVLDDTKRCTVKKRLYLQPDGYIGVEEDITINFALHDVKAQRTY